MNLKPQKVILLGAALLVGVAALIFLDNPKPAAERTPAEHEAALTQHRNQQNEFMKSSADSPLPQNERSAFEGLKYYPLNPELRTLATLTPAQNGEEIRVPNDDKLKFVGWLNFTLLGKSYRLAAFRNTEMEEKALFVPFLDATSGDETYGAGRFLDLEVGAGGSVWLDFNYAYNPFCAYNPEYICAKPPTENTLLLAIEAGEKNYHN